MADNDRIWHVLGAGAIGGLWAARLYLADTPVRLILRPEGRRRYRQCKGLTLIDGDDRRLLPISAVGADTLHSPLYRVLVCTKAAQTLHALRGLRHVLGAETSLVIVQNGLGIDEKVRELYPACHLFLGATTQGAIRPEPFTVVHSGKGETTIGSAGGGIDQALVDCAASLSVPGFPVETRADIQPVLWRKLAVNCAINPLTVVYRCRNGELLTNPEARQHLARVCTEIVAVSEALGRAHWIENLEETVTAVASATADNRSSMLQDVEAGRPTEIDHITGYLCRVAGRLGINVPENTALLSHICSLSQ